MSVLTVLLTPVLNALEGAIVTQIESLAGDAAKEILNLLNGKDVAPVVQFLQGIITGLTATPPANATTQVGTMVPATGALDPNATTSKVSS